MEIWKAIKDYENLYEVSNQGQIRSKERQVNVRNGTRTVKARIRKIFENKRGYMTVVLSKENKLKTFTVHQLVAQAFIPNFIKGTEVNHIDGNKTNNYVNNLEKSNPSHNQFHASATGLREKKGVSKYRNVCYQTRAHAVKRWAGYITHEGNKVYGWKSFHTEEEAARHVDMLLDSVGDTTRPRNFPST